MDIELIREYYLSLPTYVEQPCPIQGKTYGIKSCFLIK